MSWCFQRWPQVLADGEDIHIVGAHVFHNHAHFVVGFAESYHDATFGPDFRICGFDGFKKI